MTTVVFDGETLASDSQVTIGVMKRDGMKKIDVFDVTLLQKILKNAHSVAKVKKCFFGFSGRLDHKAALINYLVGEESEKPKLDEIEMLFACDDGRCFTINGEDMIAYETPVPASIGSGGNIADVLLAMGSNAEEAVKGAIKLDIYSGGDLQTVRVKDGLFTVSKISD